MRSAQPLRSRVAAAMWISCRSAASRLHCDKSATEFSLAALTTSGAGGSVGGGSGDMAKTRKSDGVGGSGGGHLRT